MCGFETSASKLYNEEEQGVLLQLPVRAGDPVTDEHVLACGECRRLRSENDEVNGSPSW